MVSAQSNSVEDQPNVVDWQLRDYFARNNERVAQIPRLDLAQDQPRKHLDNHTTSRASRTPLAGQNLSRFSVSTAISSTTNTVVATGAPINKDRTGQIKTAGTTNVFGVYISTALEVPTPSRKRDNPFDHDPSPQSSSVCSAKARPWANQHQPQSAKPSSFGLPSTSNPNIFHRSLGQMSSLPFPSKVESLSGSFIEAGNYSMHGRAIDIQFT
jgi:hypothetical protein